MTENVTVELGSWRTWHGSEEPIRLGVSTCLLGENVRFDGGHARARFVTDVLAKWVEFVPVCPEVEIGMGIPRPSIRLADRDGEQRLIAPATGEDFTDRMNEHAGRRIGELEDLGLDGYVLKKGSPSCGMERIKTYRMNGMPASRNQSGLFARQLIERWPALPLEEEGRLNDPVLRENFIERVFCRNRWRTLVAGGRKRRRLVEFHTAHKLLIRAHNETGYRRLGKIVGEAGKTSDKELFAAYELELQGALKTRATRKKHANVLYHALGYLKNLLGSTEKRELISAIEDYRQGFLPLVVPLTLLRYDTRRHGIDYLAGQLYFDPHPKELMLRNHV